MQLDKTRIAIRERSQTEIFDLALHVVRAYFRPWLVLLVLGVLPFAWGNNWLIGWMLPSDSTTELLTADGAAENVFRYLWTMLLLVYLEAPLATALVTTYVGHAVFWERPALRKVVADTARSWFPLSWFLLIWRGILPAVLLAWAIDRLEPFSPAEAWMLLLALVVSVPRSSRPYLVEIILLERNPMHAKNKQTLTITRRASSLQAPASGDLSTRWIYAAVYAAMLSLALLGTITVLGRFLSLQQIAVLPLIYWGWPVSLWLVAGFLAVVRFLSYLDLRIRHEGWEVELRMRAEGARVRESLAAPAG